MVKFGDHGPALRRVLLFCLVALVPSFASAADSEKTKRPPTADRIDFEVTLAPEDPFSKENQVGATLSEVKRGESFFVVITGKPRKGYHTYPLKKHTPSQGKDGLSKLKIEKSATFIPLPPVIESEPELVDEGPSVGSLYEYKKPFTWSQEILVSPDAKPGPAPLRLRIHLQVCDNSCVWGDHDFELPLTVSEAPAVSPSPEVQEKLRAALAPPKPRVQKASDEFRSVGVLSFVGSGVWWGLISLLTPCVFPMIPITVSFFLKQSEQKQHAPLVTASVYSATIVAVLTLGGLVLITVLQPFSQHYATNFVMGVLFLFFALSLFGMYEIVLPSGLANFTSAHEGRGGLVGTFFMALTFTIISFACVAPFYGTFIAFAASANSAADQLKLFLGALAYSATFASPFFVLALFPTLMRALPRSGAWMNTVKAVMGFVELAAAFKFLRAAELNFFSGSSFLTFELVLGIYVTLSVLCGLYLLNFFRLPHDYDAPATVGVPRLLIACAFVALGVYLAPGLLKQGDGARQRPAGTVYAWVESFVLPETSNSGWLASLSAAVKQAEAEDRLIFVDFTGLG